MENNKYYTPELEELHVGLEIEYSTEYLGEEITEWNKSTFRLEDHWLLEEKHIRVKYLDKEDIESLGWKHELRKGNKYENVYHLGEDIYTIVNKGLHILVIKPYCNKITIKHPNFIRDGSGNFKDYITEVYEIEIKNKSELKKLMKQLGINE